MKFNVLFFFVIPFMMSNAYGLEINISSWVGENQVGSADLRQIENVISHAIGIYSRILKGPRPIRLEVEFKSLGSITIARGGSRYMIPSGFPYQIYFPCTLLCQILDRDVLPDEYYHAHIIINTDFINAHDFDYSLAPQVPVGKKDFLHVMLHELGHCMGFHNLINDDGSWYQQGTEPSSSDLHSWGLIFEDFYGDYIQITSLNYNAERADALNSNMLFWFGANVVTHAGHIFKVYAPASTPRKNNSSHWDISHSPDELMEPTGGINLRDFGALNPALRDLGWVTSSVGIVPPYLRFLKTSYKSGETQPIFITNNMDVNTNITLSIMGPHASEFSAVGVPGIINLVPYETAVIDVSGTPVSIGYKTAILRAEYNDGTDRVSEVTLDMFAISEDTDGDGLSDNDETRGLLFGTWNPFDWEEQDSTGENGSLIGDGVADGYNDFDGDGMTNAEEFIFGYNPADPDSFGRRSSVDTDGDGILDEDEINDPVGIFDPYFSDSSGDSFSDEPDGIPDGQNDYDGDGYSNAFEYQWGLNPFEPDYDVPFPASSRLAFSLIILCISSLACLYLNRKKKGC